MYNNLTKIPSPLKHLCSHGRRLPATPSMLLWRLRFLFREMPLPTMASLVGVAWSCVALVGNRGLLDSTCMHDWSLHRWRIDDILAPILHYILLACHSITKDTCCFKLSTSSFPLTRLFHCSHRSHRRCPVACCNFLCHLFLLLLGNHSLQTTAPSPNGDGRNDGNRPSF